MGASREVEMVKARVNALSSPATERGESVEALAHSLHLPPGVVVPNSPNVAAYLAHHVDLREPVQTIAETLVEEFGENSEISLDLYMDREIDDQYLCFYVRQSEYDDDLMERLEEASTRYEDALAECSGWILITTDFRPE